MPGVILGYASTYRLPREDFFRACGRNLWRFIRLLIIAGIAMGIVAGVLFGIRGALIKAAGESTNELLPFYTSMACLFVIFLVMSVLRIWFDLAQADVVLSDRKAVRRARSLAYFASSAANSPSTVSISVTAWRSVSSVLSASLTVCWSFRSS